MAYAKRPKGMKEDDRLTGDGGEVKFTDLRFERGNVREGRKEKARRSMNCTFLG